MIKITEKLQKLKKADFTRGILAINGQQLLVT